MDNFIERSVYSWSAYISRRSIHLLPEDQITRPRAFPEKLTSHVEYFPRPDVITSRAIIQRSIISALCSYAHWVLNLNIAQKNVVSVQRLVRPGLRMYARVHANSCHGNCVNPNRLSKQSSFDGIKKSVKSLRHKHGHSRLCLTLRSIPKYNCLIAYESVRSDT